MLIHIITFLIVSFSNASLDKQSIVYQVNEVRSKGCVCGGERMEPAGPIIWNEKLYRSATAHAEDMRRNNYFSHYSKKGEDVGKRVDRFKYNWLIIGENIASGQEDFDEVMRDWLDSPTHCKMIMDPHVNEMAVAKSGKYWVQHFGKRKESNVK